MDNVVEKSNSIKLKEKQLVDDIIKLNHIKIKKV